jgi:CRISPR-associated protein Csm1
LVLYHHEPKNSNNPKLVQIIRKADHHASGERIKDENKDNVSVNRESLISIFSRVKLNETKENQEYHVPLEQLSLDSFDKLKPQLGNVTTDYRVLWRAFEKEMKRMNSLDFNTTLAILKKYTSTIPSVVYKAEADISLFDHLKTTAALATCRFRYHQETKKLHQTDHQEVYLVITGDVSGIQNFIYKVSSPKAQSGMSQRLRGRSLYLNLLNDAIASKLVKDLGLNQSNILFCGGGRFNIISPNTEKAKLEISKFRDKINNLFIKKFNSELYLSLESKSCSGNDLKRFGEITAELNSKISENKKHKFINQLDKVFEIEKEVKHDKTCSVCGKETYNDICVECESHKRLGRNATNSAFMIKCFLKSDDNYKSNFNYDFYEKDLSIGYLFKNYRKTVDFIKNLNDVDEKYEKIEVIRLNSTEFLDKDIVESVNSLKEDLSNKISLSFNFLGNTIPRHPETTLYFEHLAKISKGADKLGIVKMDVDNLGKIFTTGFKHLGKETDDEKEIDEGGTISRISTLSSQLDMFFSGFINEIAKEYRIFKDICPNCKEKVEKGEIEKITLNIQNDDLADSNSNSESSDNSSSKRDSFTVYKEIGEKVCSDCEKESNTIPTIHINYSGGDDLLVFGPYDDIMEFSKEFRKKFREWTCQNPAITLSAGINIVDSKFPIGKAAIQADDYLEASKNCGKDKDKITLFNDVVKWESGGNFEGYYELLDFAKELEKYVEKGDISRGMVYNLLRLWQDTFLDYSEIPNGSDEWTDNNNARIQRKKYVPNYKYKLRLIKNNTIKDDLDKKGIKFMPYIRIPVSWTSLRTR